MSVERPGFGDNVRIRPSPKTEAAGVAGLAGQVYGETTPSATGVNVIGNMTEDCAVNVFFKETGKSLWFAPELVEFIDHAPGTEVRLQGVEKKWVRRATGEWDEVPVSSKRRGLVERLLGLFRRG